MVPPLHDAPSASYHGVPETLSPFSSLVVDPALSLLTPSTADDDDIRNRSASEPEVVCGSSESTATMSSASERHTVGPQWGFLALGVFPIWMLVGNSLVLLALLLQRNLQNLSNRVIASLAVTDFLLALFVVPLGIYQLVLGHWNLGFYVCLAWTGSDVVLSTASIMHLCAIALHRYHGIAHPLRMRTTGAFGGLDGRMSGGAGSSGGRRVAALVGPAWGIAIALSIPFVVQGVLDQSYVLASGPSSSIYYGLTEPVTTSLSFRPTCGFLPLTDFDAGTPTDNEVESGRSHHVTDDVLVSCGIFNRSFAIYSSLVSFFIPLGIMIVADFRSVQILRKNVHFPYSSATQRSKFSSSTSTSSTWPRSMRRSGPSSGSPPSTRCCLVGSDRCWTPAMSCYGSATLSTGTDIECDTETNLHGTADYASSTAVVTAETESPVAEVIASRLHPGHLSPNVIYGRSPSRTTPDDDREEQATTATTDCGSPRVRRVTLSSPSSTSASASTATYIYRSRSRSKSLVYIDMLASCGSAKINGRERRAEKTLIWVFAAFVALWLPFFCANLTYGLCGIGLGGDGSGLPMCDVPPTMFTAFAWLGYLSSGVNPCIYTLLNRDFRSAFRNLITCRHGRLRRKANGSMRASALSHFTRATVHGESRMAISVPGLR